MLLCRLGGVPRGLFFTFAYYWWGRLYKGGVKQDTARLALTTLFIAIEMIEE